MHNLYANFVKILDICNKFAKNLVNEHGNILRRGPVPKFSDLEVIALSLMAESLSIDSENNLFVRPPYIPFAKRRKRIETCFSQFCDQFMMIRNYAKQTEGLFARIIGKVSAFTVLQYINHINNRPIGRVKYALI